MRGSEEGRSNDVVFVPFPFEHPHERLAFYEWLASGLRGEPNGTVRTDYAHTPLKRFLREKLFRVAVMSASFLSRIEARALVTCVVVICYFAGAVYLAVHAPQFFVPYISQTTPMVVASLTWFFLERHARDLAQAVQSAYSHAGQAAAVRTVVVRREEGR